MFLRLPVALIILLSLVTAAFASPTKSSGRKCGNEPTPEEIHAKESKFANALFKINNSTRVADNFSSYTIPVKFHVIYSGMGPGQGYVSDKQIQDQIGVLNQDFTNTGLKFNVVSTTRTLNAEWFEAAAPGTPEQTAMKTQLHSGGPDVLNLYSVSFNKSGLLGYSEYPVNYHDDPTNDGVVIRYSTLPGGTYTPFNLGRTATHEVGHWVGLYHTFEGGCTGQGDYVSDTAAEASPAYGCPSKRDTCTSMPGFDPIHNFMDYTDDSCMNNFTGAQVVRLRNQINTYRGIPL